MKKYIFHAAPLQGITQYTWRNAHYAVFGGIDYYHTPFMRIEQGEIRSRDLVDVAPENNIAPIITQIIACEPYEASIMIRRLQDMGHKHIELNFGCPHPPLAKKHKGSGMLAYPSEIEQLCTQLATITAEYSVKMRLGWDKPDQWRDAVKALAPLSPSSITIHPRIGIQQYKGDLHMGQFEALISECQYPIIYNGELKSLQDIERIINFYPDLAGVMIGRGLVTDPAMLTPQLATADHYRLFHDKLLRSTTERLIGGEHQVLSHMKVFWEMFLLNANKKLRKQILKAHSISQYIIACNELFSTL